MDRREDERKRLLAIKWKLMDSTQALEEARDLSEDLGKTHSTYVAVDDVSKLALPGIDRAIEYLRSDLESM